MSEQLWGIGGVVAGIVVTAAGSWWNDRSKHQREHAMTARQENRKRCEALLANVDDELGALDNYQNEHGVFPADDGYHPVSAARNHLRGIQLNCPPKIHAAAVALVDALEARESRGGTKEDVDGSRDKFVGLVREKL